MYLISYLINLIDYCQYMLILSLGSLITGDSVKIGYERGILETFIHEHG